MPESMKAGIVSLLVVVTFAVGLMLGGRITDNVRMTSSTYIQEVPTIGGSRVPTVHCQEDETIFWLGVDTLGCVHAEAVNK